MGAKLLLESMRDTSGCFQGNVLEGVWAALPERFRTVELDSAELEPADRAAFTLGKHQRGFRLRFGRLPAPMDREMAWCCWRIVDLGGRVPVGSMQGLVISLARATEDHPQLRGSLMQQTPREWERALAAAYARHYGRLPGKGWMRCQGSQVEQARLLRRWAERTDAAWAISTTHLVHALLASGADAEKHFRLALDVPRARSRPFTYARTRLPYGEWLRRAGRRTDARTQLAEAAETFRLLDPAPLLARTWAEQD
ncbi:hypothetical protein [Streptomyces sp. Ag109_O5-1]|uniref:hypothetical protein n=1 Tax=Streptomyces sp. Ag109_O5-1 TaxID=1938851 RepID=UPI0021A4E027|nr:hypothetical protein [Streptomyces sp. Ag109_O5-1]